MKRVELYAYYKAPGLVNPDRRVTVCSYLENIDGRWMVVARGVSICSVSDMPCKRAGRGKAKGRALEALHAEGDLWLKPIRRPEAIRVLESVVEPAVRLLAYKAQAFPVVILPHEQRAIDRRQEQAA